MKNPLSHRLPMLAALAALMVSTLWAQFPPDYCARPEYTTGDFDQAGVPCPPEGQGDFSCPLTGDRGSDPILNRLKNRDVLPDDLTPVPITVREILDYVPPTAAQQFPRQCRTNWPPEALDEVQPWECQPVVVEGYLVQRNIEGPESCNCETTQPPYVDFHVFLGETPNPPRGERLVIELTPRVFAQHPTWTDALIAHLAQRREKVRITGWRMWDPLHADEVGQSRGTLWEIHPVHKIEVQLDKETWLEV